MGQYDSIIIGAGHNGLVCAAYLAKSGQRVLVLEAADTVGGLAADREFHPGFHASVAHSVGHFSATVAADLKLTAHGYSGTSDSLATIGLSSDGKHVVVQDNSIVGASDEDSAAYSDYLRLMSRFADVLKPFWQKTMPRIGSANVADLITFARIGIKLRLIGKNDILLLTYRGYL